MFNILLVGSYHIARGNKLHDDMFAQRHFCTKGHFCSNRRFRMETFFHGLTVSCFFFLFLFLLSLLPLTLTSGLYLNIFISNLFVFFLSFLFLVSLVLLTTLTSVSNSLKKQFSALQYLLYSCAKMNLRAKLTLGTNFSSCSFVFVQFLPVLFISS